jgi:hypothetical protein
MKAEEAAHEADLLAVTHPAFRSDRLLLLGLEHRGENAADTALKLAQRDSTRCVNRPQIALVHHPAGVVEVVRRRVAEQAQAAVERDLAPIPHPPRPRRVAVVARDVHLTNCRDTESPPAAQKSPQPQRTAATRLRWPWVSCASARSVLVVVRWNPMNGSVSAEAAAGTAPDDVRA